MKMTKYMVAMGVMFFATAHAQTVSNGPAAAVLLYGSTVTSGSVALSANTSAPATCNSSIDGYVALNGKRLPCYCNGNANQWQQMGQTAFNALSGSTIGPVACVWNP